MSSAIGSTVVVDAVEVADILSYGLPGARVDGCWVLGRLARIETFTVGVEMLVAEVEVAGSLPSRIACSLL